MFNIILLHSLRQSLHTVLALSIKSMHRRRKAFNIGGGGVGGEGVKPAAPTSTHILLKSKQGL